MKENPKLFWNYHKAILHNRLGSNTEITFDRKTAKTAAEKAELFNDCFCSVFTSSRQDNAFVLQSYPTRINMQISEITLSFNEARDCLSNLDPSKATGPDEIPARVLKECSEQIAPSFVPYSIILYVLGAFLQIGSQLILRQFIRKIFRNQLKIIDQPHYFQS